ncbi:hypothetical protein SK069_09760 [Patulibacter brassicae]|uniref:Uncharacterized protein n=1 Tax=Patulibacter brassicae TaxID=1705717 RepID=A0ABU4VLW4_9ACTN|nr:hypothetical protein [Patulibacter brassicae]MDX8151878.1 hypothetical protein [Patulibacter brassicae]
MTGRILSPPAQRRDTRPLATPGRLLPQHPPHRAPPRSPAVDGAPRLTVAERADIERRYFTWCADKGLEPSPEHGATASEIAAMRDRFAVFLARRQKGRR